MGPAELLIALVIALTTPVLVHLFLNELDAYRRSRAAESRAKLEAEERARIYAEAIERNNKRDGLRG